MNSKEASLPAEPYDDGAREFACVSRELCYVSLECRPAARRQCPLRRGAACATGSQAVLIAFVALGDLQGAGKVSMNRGSLCLRGDLRPR